MLPVFVAAVLPARLRTSVPVSATRPPRSTLVRRPPANEIDGRRDNASIGDGGSRVPM